MTALPRNPQLTSGMDRRTWLIAGGLFAGGLIGYPLFKRLTQKRAPVFIARGQRYGGPLETTIQDGLLAAGLETKQLAGKRVLLKPNLVEPTRECPHMTTHPAVIVAAAEVLRGWGAIVTVGEGPGHVRDTELALAESGVGEALDSARLAFADLNYQQVREWANRGGVSQLPTFFFPQAVVEADLIVSLPKLKTHHWVGVTAAMKNMYGTIPGIKYGWPKNVLHHHGIPQTVFDINASLPPTIAIVDAIECMEGDGPIMGSAKEMGLIVVGLSLPAVDATCCRIMDLDPFQIDYLQLAEQKHLGPLADHAIEQRGERWQTVAQPFQILEKPHLQRLRQRPGVMVS